MTSLTDGLIAVVKRDCPTCNLVVQVLRDLEGQGQRMTMYSQDPAFPEGLHEVVVEALAD
jgi:hypothetical protein